MRAEDIRGMSDVEIAQSIEETSEELFTLKLKAAYEELENPSMLRALRRDIARMKTIRRERELKAASEEES